MSGTRADARKRVEEVDWDKAPIDFVPSPQTLATAAHEHRREVVQQALEAIMSGASFTDADALLDQFDTLGARVVVEGEGLIHG